MSDSRTVKTFKNASMGIVCQIATLITNFATRTLFIKFLGADYLGINGLFGNILTMLSLSELGFSSAIVYNLYKYLAKKDEEKIASQNGIRVACDTTDFCEQQNIPVSLICGRYDENTEGQVKLLKDSIGCWGNNTHDIPMNPSREQLVNYLSNRYKYVELSDIPEVRVYDSYNPKDPEFNAELVS